MKSTVNELWNGWNLAWYHNFTHIACAKKFRGLREKLDELHVQNWTISFEVSGFRTKTHLLKRDFIFFYIFKMQNFCAFIMHHAKPHNQFSTLFWLHLLFFMHLMIYFELKSTTNEPWKGWNLAWFHNFTQIACAKRFRGLRQKLDALRVQNWTISFEVWGFRTKCIQLFL